VKPWENVDRARSPDGTELILARRGDEWVVREGGRVLMSSRMHGSEEALAALALKRIPHPRTVLIGGLGLGFTVRATLDRLGPDTRVIVAEMVPELVAWNRGPVADLAGRPLEDPRVRLQMGDVSGRIAEARSAYDAILLDVDNGPSALNHAANSVLYDNKGIRRCRDALRAGGVLAVWSAGGDARYVERLERAGFDVQVHVVPGRGGGQGGVRHVVFVAARPPARRAAPPRTH
jgi:spermidine synthase